MVCGPVLTYYDPWGFMVDPCRAVLVQRWDAFSVIKKIECNVGVGSRLPYLVQMSWNVGAPASYQLGPTTCSCHLIPHPDCLASLRFFEGFWGFEVRANLDPKLGPNRRKGVSGRFLWCAAPSSLNMTRGALWWIHSEQVLFRCGMHLV